MVGLGAALLALAEGTPLVLDGDGGHRRRRPRRRRDAEQRRAARRPRRAERAAALARAARARRARATAAAIEVFANIGSAGRGAPRAVEQGAEGVGLLRTEFLFLDRATPPDEDEQVAASREIARGARRPPA